MKLKEACISRDGVEEGTETFNLIIEECSESINSGGDYDAIEEILYGEGFEPDYIMDIIDICS